MNKRKPRGRRYKPQHGDPNREEVLWFSLCALYRNSWFQML